MLVDDYLHFRFADINDFGSIVSRFNSNKSLIAQLNNKYKLSPTFYDTSTPNNIKRYESLLEFFKNPTLSDNKFIKGQSWEYMDLNRSESFEEEITENTNLMADNISKMLDYFKKLSNELTNKLGSSFQEYATEIINEYAATHGLSSSQSNVGQELLRAFISRNGLKNLQTPSFSNGDLASFLEYAEAMIEVLPYFEDVPLDYSNDNSKNSQGSIKLFIAKIQNLYNYVIKSAQKIAMIKIEELLFKNGLKSTEDIFKDLDKTIDSYSNGSLFIAANFKTRKEQLEEKRGTHLKVKKSGVDVTINNDFVRVHYDVDISKYKGNNRVKYENMSLVDNTSFLYAAINNLQLSQTELANLAAANSGESLISFDDGSFINEDVLENAWNNVIQEVTTSQLISSLLALSTNSNMSTLFLVYNGGIYPISDVLDRVLDSQVRGYNPEIDGTVSRALNRSNIVKQNRWRWANYRSGASYRMDRSREEGKKRSSLVLPTVIMRLQQAKLDISLKKLGSLL
jgi:hypothetical protein